MFLDLFSSELCIRCNKADYSYSDDEKAEILKEFNILFEDMSAQVAEWSNKDENGDVIFSAIPGTVIIGYQGSTAQAYATENGIKFTSCPLGEHTNIQFNTEGLEATCTEKGFIGGSACLDCETVIEMPEIIPAKGHSFVTDAGIPATCTQSGLTEGTHCSECGLVTVAQTVINPAGHVDKDGDNICDNCHQPVDSEEEIKLSFVDRIKQVFANIINAVLALFKKLFG